MILRGLSLSRVLAGHKGRAAVVASGLAELEIAKQLMRARPMHICSRMLKSQGSIVGHLLVEQRLGL